MLGQIGPFVLALLNLLEDFFSIGGVKGCFTNSKSVPKTLSTRTKLAFLDVRDDSNSPKIDFLIVSLPSLLQEFGGYIVWSAAHGCSSQTNLMLPDQDGCEAKIADFHVHLLVKEDIAGFEVAVDNVSVM